MTFLYVLLIIAVIIILIMILERKYVKVIKKKDPAIKSSLEVLLYPSFWAMFNHRIAHRLYKIHLYFISRLISQFSRAITGIEIHPGAKIGNGVFIDHGMGVVIGETCEIGDNVLIYQGVTLGGTGKDTGKRHPTVENNVMIGTGAKVLGPITIGANSKIGGGSVVLSDVPPYSTVVGVPGKIRRRTNITDIPSDELDQLKFPDPVEMEICKLRVEIENLKKELDSYREENKNEAL